VMRWVRAQLWWLRSAARQPSRISPGGLSLEVSGLCSIRRFGWIFWAAVIVVRGRMFACGWVGVAIVGRVASSVASYRSLDLYGVLLWHGLWQLVGSF